MKIDTVESIISTLNKLGKGEGITATLDDNPRRNSLHPVSRECWDIMLRYKDYYYVERFSSAAYIEDKDVEKVALCLIRTLLGDYFTAKASQ